MPTSLKKNITFRNQQEQPIAEFNFGGGLVTDVHETKLEQNQTSDMENVTYNDTGSILTREGYRRYNNDPIGSSVDQSNTGASSGSLTIDAPTEFVAQTYLAGVTGVVQLDVFMAMTTTGEEQLMRAELWSTSAGVPSALVEKGQILLISGTSETEYSFRLRVPATATPASTYAIIVKPYITSSTQAVNSVKVYYTGNSYANGSVYTSTDSGLNWTVDAAKDLRFRVYTGGTGATGAIRFYGDSGIQQTFVKWGNTLYRGNDQTGEFTAITLGNGSTLSTANYIDYTVSNGALLLVDGASRIQKYRGSTNANYSTGTLSVTNGSTTVTGSGTTWATATNAEAGEYIKLPDGKWYKINSVSTNTSLTIEVSYQGSTLSGQTYTISPWGEVQGDLNRSEAPGSLVRPAGKYIENHINRIWVLDGNTLRFSSLDTSISGEHFNDWDTGNNAGAIIVPNKGGDTGTGIYSFNNTLYVFQKRAIWQLYGSSPANFELRLISNEVGMVGKNTLVEWESLLVFMSNSGIYLFDGSNYQNITDGVIQKQIDSWANTTSVTTAVWKNNYMISYTPSGGTGNSEVLFYDLPRKIWGKITGLYASSFSVWYGGTDRGQLYFASSNQGSLYQFGVGGHDDGYEIYTKYVTPSLGFGAGVNDKAAKKFYLQQLAKGDYSMSITMDIDISADSIVAQLPLSGGSQGLWDIVEWDVDTWASEGSILTDRVAEFQGLAKYFKFTIEETGYDTGIEVLALVFTSRLRRLR